MVVGQLGDTHIANQGNMIHFRTAHNNQEDGERFCRLFNSLYARHVERNYYRWQFFETPFPSSLSLALTDEEDLAGTYGFHLLPAQPDGLLLAWALDIMVAPNFQGRGVFRPLARFAEAQALSYGAGALCVMANERADRVHIGGLGWHRVTVLSTSLCNTADVRLAESEIEFYPCERFEDIGELSLHSQRRHALAGSLRSAAYLDWRFVRSPWYRYDSFAVRYHGDAFGYLVLKTFRDPLTRHVFGDIMDFCWVEERPELLASILRFSLRHFRDRGVAQATVWLHTNTMLDQIGRELGFSDTNQRRYFCCKVIDERFLWLKDPRCWFLTMADSEMY